MKPLYVILPTLILAAALPLAAVAQPPGQAKKPAAVETDRGEARARPARARLKELRGRLLRQRVGLDEAKTREVEAIVQKGADERRAARQKLAEARRELRALFAKDSDDQAAWAAALAKMKEAHDATAALRARDYEALAAVLTPKEQAKLLRAMQRVQGHARAEQRRRGKLEDPFGEGRPVGPPKGPPTKKPPKTPPKSLKDPFGGR